jgi:multiple sugar transport system ATP-binding protein
VFLFDEPLSNLDAALRVQTRLEIAKLHQQIGTASMIYVTHDQVEAMTLADKIVLLRAGPDVQTHGSIAQIGTPMDLYHRPNSLFVAEFIGSPKMNILPATFLSASAGMARISVVGQVFEVAVQAEHLTAQQPVSLGLRPEHMRLASADNAPNSLPARVDHIEKLGEASLLYLQLGARLPTITLKLEGTTDIKIGTAIRLQVPAGDLHLFDSHGQALTRTISLPA